MFPVKPEMSDGVLEWSYREVTRGMDWIPEEAGHQTEHLQLSRSCEEQNQNYRNTQSERRRDRLEEALQNRKRKQKEHR